MKIQKLAQLKELIEEGWLLDVNDSRSDLNDDWRNRWDANASSNPILRGGRYKLKSPQGDIIPVEYCKGGLDEHTFKVGDRVRCKPGYIGQQSGGLLKVGEAYESGKEFTIACVNHDMAWDRTGIKTRALELVSKAVSKNESKVKTTHREFKVGDTVEITKAGQGCGEEHVGRRVQLIRKGNYIGQGDGFEVHPKIGNSLTGSFDSMLGSVAFKLVEAKVEETDLDYAKRLYPIGTKIKSLYIKGREVVVDQEPTQQRNGDISSGGVFLRWKGEWATIVIQVKSETEESIIEKAKRLYPVGTRYKSAKPKDSDDEVYVSTGLFGEGYTNIWGVDSQRMSMPGYIKHKDNWAEIVKDTKTDTPDRTGWKVSHKDYGEGVIECRDGSRDNWKIIFKGHKSPRYLNWSGLERLDEESISRTGGKVKWKSHTEKGVATVTDGNPRKDQWTISYEDGLTITNLPWDRLEEVSDPFEPKPDYIDEDICKPFESMCGVSTRRYPWQELTGIHSHLSKESDTNKQKQDVRSSEHNREEREIDGLMDSLLRSKRRNRSETRASEIQSIIEEDYRED